MNKHHPDLRSTKLLKQKLRNRETLFAGWLSFGHASIAEIFAMAGFDFMLIDIEHSTISLEQAQRIIAASQAYSIPCIPRPVSHNNDYIKPLLESGADGLLAQMVNTKEEAIALRDLVKYPPLGKRTYGVNRAQSYGFTMNNYFSQWNANSIFMVQIESAEAVRNIDSILELDDIDGVMIGPLDIAGSLGVPGEVMHPTVIEASQLVIESCKNHGISCGTQVAQPTPQSIKNILDLGYNFVILGSDLFVLQDWALNATNVIESFSSF